MIVGVSESAWVNLIMTIFNIILIFFIIIYGAFFIDVSNWTPFLPYGYSGVFNGAAVVFFSYVGFDSVTTLAGEVANTKRDLPVGIVGTLGMVTLLYCLVSLVITGMLPPLLSDWVPLPHSLLPHLPLFWVSLVSSTKWPKMDCFIVFLPN